MHKVARLTPMGRLRMTGWLHGPIASLMWLPMLAFEVPLALWLIARGVATGPHASGMIRSG